MDPDAMMPANPRGRELFIVDNSGENWKGVRHLGDWRAIASNFDIATGFVAELQVWFECCWGDGEDISEEDP